MKSVGWNCLAAAPPIAVFISAKPLSNHDLSNTSLIRDRKQFKLNDRTNLLDAVAHDPPGTNTRMDPQMSDADEMLRIFDRPSARQATVSDPSRCT